MANKTKVIHVAVDPATHRKLRFQAKISGLPVSSVIRSAVKAHLDAAWAIHGGIDPNGQQAQPKEAQQ